MHAPIAHIRPALASSDGTSERNPDGTG